MDEQPIQTYTCTASRPNGGICGYTTNDPTAACPHDGIIVSTGEKYIAPKKERLCPTCGQEWPRGPKLPERVSGTMEPSTVDDIEAERRREAERAHSQPAFSVAAEDPGATPKGPEEDDEAHPPRPADGSQL